MTLVDQVNALATRVAGEFKTLRSQVATDLSGKANNGHTHVVSDVASLQGLLDAKLGLTGGTLSEGANLTFGTTTGTKIGTATTQKLGFFNATPVVQQTATTDLGVALSNLGLRAAGTAYPLTTSGNASLTGTVTTNKSRVKTPANLTTTATLNLTSAEIQTADASAAPFSITLPATTTPGYHFTIKKTDGTANAVTILGTIDGATNVVLSRGNDTVTLVSTATSGTWRVVARISTSTIADISGLQAALDSKVGTSDPRLTDARTPTTHSHAIGDVTGLQAALDGKSATGHSHAWGEITDKPATFAPTIGSGAADAVAGNDPRLSDARTPTSHVHPAAQISDSTTVGRAVLTAADAAAARSAIGAGTSSLALGTTAGTAKAGDYAPTWGEITSKPASFAPSAHTHAISEVTNLQTALDGKAASSHTHLAVDISNSTTVGRSVLTATDAAAARSAIGAGTGNSNLALGTTAGTAKAGDYVPAWSEVTGKPSSFTPAAHSHAVADVTGLQTALDGKSDSGHTHAATAISDSTVVGRSVLTAADAAAARTAIGAGTSSLTIGTTGTTAKAGNYVPAWTEITSKPSTFPPDAHSHAWNEITSKPTTFAPTAHTHVASEVSDSTAVGRSVLTATDAAAARSAIGAGTGSSNLALGTTSTTAKAGDYVPTWSEITSKPSTFTPSSHTHLAADISNSTAVGRSLMTAADAAAARTAIGAGTSNLVLGTTSDTAAAGNDSRLSDARVPLDNSVTNVKIPAGADISPTKLGAGRVVAVDGSDTPISIVKKYLTQAQYDAIGTKDPNTEYNII
ncbi:minor tail protein [Gordonia phage RedWattleHog]|nr:minor tail protein [Gordonia phage RedWattleHog]